MCREKSCLIILSKIPSKVSPNALRYSTNILSGPGALLICSFVKASFSSFCVIRPSRVGLNVGVLGVHVTCFFGGN